VSFIHPATRDVKAPLKPLPAIKKTGLPFGLIKGLNFSLSSGWKVEMSSGLVSGLVFGSGLAGFMALQRKRAAGSPPVFPERLSAMTALPLIS
jgi:hypothetical protein